MKVLLAFLALALVAAACSSGDEDTTDAGDNSSENTDASDEQDNNADSEDGDDSTAEDASGDGPSGEVTLYHRYTDNTEVALDAGFDYCRSQLPGIDLQVTNVSGEEYEVQLPIRLSSDEPPDIYALWPGGRPIFQSQNGLIEPITAFYNESIAPNYSEGVNNGVVENDGEVYVLPINIMPNAFYYRTDIFEEYGLSEPETWDEFLVVLETLKSNGQTPIALGSGRGWEPLFWFDYMVLRVAGPEFREGLMWGTESYNDPLVIEAMEMWAELLDAGYFNDDITSRAWADMTPMMADGSAAMMLMGPWAMDTLLDAGLEPDTGFGMFPFPTIDPSVPAATEGAMEGWATTGANDNTEAVHAVLECIASADHLEIYLEIAPRPSPNPSMGLDIYAEPVQPYIERLVELTGNSFHQNMELATTPPVTDVAKREIPRFLTFPDQYPQVLQALEDAAQAEFG